ncbi:MAG: universal stress protein [Gammaproteobacteria bacterium]|nr:universal stress protein [Gammaproteobacteria bacterium]
MTTKKLIVYPTDFSECSLVALHWVRTLAQSLDADVSCLYVVEEPHIYSTLDVGPVAIPSLTELVRSAETRLDGFIKSNLKNFGKAPKAVVLVGRAADEIVAHARENAAELIVMATHGYSGVRHLLLGSTTESVLRHAICPVLSIRSV